MTFLFYTLSKIPQRNSIALLLIKDVSASAKENSEFKKVNLQICKEISSISKKSLVASIKYADYAESSNQWNDIKDFKNSKCSDEKFEPLEKGTQPQKGIDKATELLKRDEVKNLRPLVILTVHADEPIDPSQPTDHSKTLTSLTILSKEVSERKGFLVVISGSYDGLKRELQKEASTESIVYCTSQSIDLCNFKANSIKLQDTTGGN